MRPIPTIVFFFLFQIVPKQIIAQESDKEQALYSFFDSITTIENSEIHSGLIYKEKHRTKSRKSKFFPEPNFVTGSVVFNNQPYYNLQIKYNVYDDELLLQVKKKYGGDILQVHKLNVNNFKLNNHSFLKIENKKLGAGYYEVISIKNKLKLLLKRKKSIHEILDKKLVFYEFEDAKNEYYLSYKNNLYSIEKYTDFTSVFPDLETELTKHYKALASNLTFESKLKKLLSHLDFLLTSTPTKI
ncbi:hypothetical protein [Aurantibacter sp.]|uniref:hypothetical protein n=1 Tax=Aurantibacter sp. TaxID=2807103 RepID=UPI003264490A